MIRYARPSTITPPSRKNFKINAFGGFKTGIAENLIDLSQSKYCYNYVAGDGELRQGVGTVKAELKWDGAQTYVLPQPTKNVKNIFYYNYFKKSENKRDDRLIVQLVDNEIYSLSILNKSQTYDLIDGDVGEIYTAVRYKFDDDDCMILACEKGLFILSENTLEKVENAPDIRDICIHNERAFACVKGEGIALWFSGSLNPADWSVSAESGGFINFANYGGALKKVLSFGGYLYVFREYGIERVYAYGEQAEFNVRTVYSSTDRIYEKTVCVCGDKILFLSEKGLHAFDGLNVSPYPSVIDSSDISGRGNYAVATYYKGVYYLNAYLKSMDSDEGSLKEDFLYNNVIIAFNTTNGCVDIMSDYDIKRFCVLTLENSSALMMCIEPTLQESRARIISMDFETCKRCGKPATMYWRTGMTDLGYPEKKKVLKSINVTCEKDLIVGVMLDDEIVEKRLSYGLQTTININKKFKKFGLYFRTVGIVQRIGNPVITVDMR